MAKRIAVLTSGGDAPGMNAAVRAVVRGGLAAGFEVFGVQGGYRGLIDASEQTIRLLNDTDVADSLLQGGTVLHSAREDRMRQPEGRAQAAQALLDRQIDSLVVIGGDGSFTGALLLHREHNIHTIGLPGTIDNDMAYTDWTIGFDTAMNTALRAMAQIRDTMNSHLRVCFVETMGRNCGDIALYAGLAAGAEAIMVPEVPCDIAAMAQKLANPARRAKVGGIVAVAEGVGKAVDIAAQVQALQPSLEVRHAVLGHLQRGGVPTARDNVLASQLGAQAVELLCENCSAQVVGVQNEQVIHMDIEQAMATKRTFNRKLYEVACRLG